MKSNNVFGIIGVKAVDANWNASFDKYPKALVDGTIIGSDKALKYAIRNFWHMTGEKVLYRKHLAHTDGNIRVVALKEKYETMFGCELSKDVPASDIISNILSAIDCKQFGYTFAPNGGPNFNAAGPVQIGIGRNINPDTNFNDQTILSPFANQSEDDAAKKAASLGNVISVDNANYCYPFSIIPKQLDMSNIGIDIQYEEEDYKKFLQAAAVGVNAINSCAKFGCNNEYVLVVEAKDDKMYLNNLAQHVSYEDGTLILDALMAYLNGYKDRIASITLYYDSSLVKVADYVGLIKRPLYELEEL